MATTKAGEDKIHLGNGACQDWEIAAFPGLAFGLALAVRVAVPAEVSRP